MSITINGSTGISGVDGSSTTPAFQGTDTNTGLFYGTDIVGISTGGSERVRVDASGNVGIGTTPSAWGSIFKTLQIGSGIGTAFLGGRTDSVNNCQLGLNAYYDTTDSRWEYVASSTATRYYQSEGTHVWDTAASGTANNAITWSERMRIDSSGNVLIGQTANTYTGKVSFTHDSSVDDGLVIRDSRTTGGSTQISFIYNTTQVGRIHTTSSATTYATSSDYRLKENVVPMVGALDKVALLKPVTYSWKIDGSDGQGFIAHELQAVLPDAVVGEKDAVDADGNPQYQGIDTSFLVATLTAAIQEQQTIINDLKARVTALETNNV